MQALRTSVQKLASTSSFEDLLCGADGGEGGTSAPHRRLGGPGLLPVSLLRRPHIFTLGIVWESQQVSVAPSESGPLRLAGVV